jgi:hypothetical protein
MLKRQLILVATSGVLVSTLPSLPALADDGAAKAAGKDGSASLDSMWIDQEAPTIDKDVDTKGKAGTVASVGGMPSLQLARHWTVQSQQQRYFRFVR